MRTRISTGEDAVAQLVIAPHAVGADVSVVSLYQSMVNLESPFSVDPESCVDLLPERTDGGVGPR